MLSLRLHVLTLAFLSIFSFVTSAQSVVPGSISKPITVEMPQVTIETFDLDFHSTSGTAQFLAASGGKVSKVMAKGTKTRTFYYMDTVFGTASMTVTATGRTSKQVFSTTQDIIIASTAPVPVTTISQKKSQTSIPPKAKESVVATTSTQSVTSLPQTAAAVVYTAPPAADPLAEFFSVPGRLWYWLLSIF